MHDENQKKPTQETSCDDPPGEKTSGDLDVLSLIEDVERHLLRIRTAQSKQADEFNEIANRMQAAEQAEQELARHTAQLDADRTDIDEQRGAITNARAETEDARRALEEDEKNLSSRCKKIDADLESLREGRVALSKREEELDARATELESQAEKFEKRLGELEKEREELLAQKSEAENSVAANEAKIEQAENDLADAMKRAESSEARFQELNGQCESLSNDADKARSQLRMAGERLAELADVVSEQSPQLEQGAAAIASMQEQARTIADLEKRLAEVPVTDEKSLELQEAYKKAQKRANELEEALVIAQDKGQAQEFAKQLRSKAENLSEFAHHLQRRKLRLNTLRQGMKGSEKSDESQSTFRSLQRLKTQQEDLKQARKCLVVSEKAMLSKWARPRAFASVVWLSAMLFCVGGGAWLVVENMMSSPGRATVDLVASTRSGRPLENTSLTEWMQWHKALPTDPAFVNVVAKRLSTRGLNPMGGEEAVAQMLVQNLALDSDGPGRLRLILEGDDKHILSSQLDVIATTMASESARQAPRREQSARAMIVGEKNSTGRVQYASLAPSMIDSAFLMRYGIVVGVGMTLALALAAGVYAVLRRAKRIFEESEMGFEPNSGDV